jgi:hypothetical protein
MMNESLQKSAQYVSVGYSTGLLRDPKENSVKGQKQPGWWIRAGQDFYELDPISTALWLRAQIPMSFQALVETIAHFQVDRLQAITELLDEHLLISLPFEQHSPSESLLSLRALPQGVGLGQSATNPSQYQIGTLYGDVAVTCDFTDYIFWTFCDGQRSLREIMVATARHLKCEENPIKVKMSRFLPALLRTRVVALDRLTQTGESFHVMD